MVFISNLKKKYLEECVPGLMRDLNLRNVMEVPRLVKVCVNQGVGCVSEDKKFYDIISQELTNICGQRAVPRPAKKAISNFKIRQGLNVGCMVTLRGDKMYSFLDRLINIVLPRIRDFNGISSNAFDKSGCYNLGIKEQIVFPEVNIDQVVRILGMNISIITNTKDRDRSFALLKMLGFPFEK